MRWTLPLLLSWSLLAPSAGVAETAPVFAAYTSEGGSRDIREVRLLIDGKDVTARAVVTSLRVAYTPEAPLPPGTHQARVEVVDGLGRRWSKEWSFTTTAPTSAVDHVWSEQLVVELDRPPRRVRTADVVIAGWTQPGAEAIVRVTGSERARAIAGASGRFSTRVGLGVGDNAIEVAARRLTGQGDESAPVLMRVERVVSRSTAPPDDDDVATRPPAWRHPDHAGRPRAVSAGGRGAAMAPGAVIRPPVLDPPGDDPPGDDPPGDDPPDTTGEVIITKPADGATLQPAHVTVLGRAPAGWLVTILVNGSAAGDDIANPAGHFTVPRVELERGANELIAEATQGGRTLRSTVVRITAGGAAAGMPKLALATPARGSTLARGGVQRVSGTAWSGAEIEVERNGRVVARDVARGDGWFDVTVPLESGLNVLSVEAFSMDGMSARSRDMAVTSSGAATLPRAPRRIEPVVRPAPPERAPSPKLPESVTPRQMP